MTNSAGDAPAAAKATAPESGGFVKDWVLPILLGLVIGGGLVLAWRAGRGLFRSKAWNLVEKWQMQGEDVEDPDAIVKELHALGPSARADLVDVLHDLPAERLDTKLWVAHQLAGEPWFDTASLKELVKDEKAAKEVRRAAACALVDTQGNEVDVDLVLPVLEAWVADASSPDRAYAVPRIEQLWRAGKLSSAAELRVKHVLLELAKRPASPPKEDEDRFVEARGAAILALVLGLPDDDIQKMMWTVAGDPADDELPRINAVRGLSEGDVLGAGDVDQWAKLSKAELASVRQSVADNLFRAKLPEYDKILEPLQFDASPLARFGALDAQTKRRRPTMLARFDELVEDSDKWVRFSAMFASGVFKSETEKLPQRVAMMLRLLETSEVPEDVMGAALAMKLITDKVYGFDKPDDVRLREQTIDEDVLKAFMADKKKRADAAESWRKHVGAAAVWTDGDRTAALEKLLKHADPANVERAQQELAKLKKN